MQKHTIKGVEKNWSKLSAKSRAKRQHSSAPLGKELENYEKLFKKAIGKNRFPIVLILGATPELRDLSVKYNSICIAVDVSQDMINNMNVVMKYRKHPKNLSVAGDWLKLTEMFKANTFDVVMGDGSLNNIPYKKQPKIIRDLSIILKKGGYFITRSHVYMPEKELDDLVTGQKTLKEGKLNRLYLTLL